MIVLLGVAHFKSVALISGPDGSQVSLMAAEKIPQEQPGKSDAVTYYVTNIFHISIMANR